MFTHLLVPLDFTQKNEVAIRMASELAARDDAQVTLMHVVETIDNTESADFESFYQQLRAKCSLELSNVAHRLEAEGLVVDQRIAIGKPLAEVIRGVAEMPVDLVVLSSHKVDFERGASSWGTLSYQLSVLCPCPVLLVK